MRVSALLLKLGSTALIQYTTTNAASLPLDLDLPSIVAPKMMARSNVIDNPVSSGESNLLTTSYAGTTGQAGNMFDVTALSDVTITSLDLNMLHGSANCTVYYKIGKYTGFETMSEYWTPIFQGVIEGEGNGVATPLDSSDFSAVSIPAGSVRSFYVTLDKPNLRYSVGTGENSLAASNNELEIYTGLGTAYPEFSTYVSNRLWNGSIRYVSGLSVPVVEDPGTGGDSGISTLTKLETTFAGGSGQAGNMFDVAVPDSSTVDAVIISRMDIHTLWEEEEFTIYGKAGSYVGSEMDESAWTLLGQGVVQGKGVGAPTTLPFGAFEPVMINKGHTYSFYVTLSRPNLRYTVGNGSGLAISSNNDLQIFEGLGTALPSFEAHVSNRAWNGALYYSTISTDAPTTTPSKTPSLSPTSTCDVLREDATTFFKTTSDLVGLVQFDYELITAEWVDLSQALKIIEEEIATEVVHHILGCDGERRHLRSRKLDGQGIVGVNQNPIDEVDGDHECIASTPSMYSTCRAIHGEMYIYIDEHHVNEVEVLVTEALSGIQAAMIAGEFENVLLGIEKVTFIGTRNENSDVDGGDLAAAVGSQPLDNEDGKDSMSTFGALFTSAACVAVVAALATAFVLYRRMTSNKHNLDDDDSDFQANQWETGSDCDAASRVSFDNDYGRTRAVRFEEVNGQIIGRFDSGGSFDVTEQYNEPSPGSPSQRSSTMNVHKCTSATCEKCVVQNKRTKFVPASAPVNGLH